MLTVSNVRVYDLKESVIACRNAMRVEMPEYTDEEFEKSLVRAKKLVFASATSKNVKCHDNFLTGIRVSFDLVYPGYISPELQRYHWVDIVTSSSKMHRLLCMDLDKSCTKYVTQRQIDELQSCIDLYNAIDGLEWVEGMEQTFVYRDGSKEVVYTKKDALYKAFMFCINNTPQGLELFMRVSTNYKELQTMYHQRKHHKLVEDWQDGFCKDFVEQLPYAKEFITGE